MKKRIAGLIGFWMLVLLIGQNVSAAAPKMNCGVTLKNVLALLDAYDADGAYLVRTVSQNGNDMLKWALQEENIEHITDAIDTIVHESFHSYTVQRAPMNSEDIYIGNKQYTRVKYTHVFRSRKMGATIPKSLRTFRWETYVGRPDSNMASDVDGVYGLLNEFAAYYWGMHTQMALYPYYRDYHATPDQWGQFITSCANDRLAYAEFKYYILNYLVYAKKYQASDYNKIIKNTKFVSTYRSIEKKFASLNTQFEKRLKDIKNLLESQGYQVRYDNQYYYILKNGSGYGVGLFKDDYNKLIAEIQKSPCKNAFGSSGSSATSVAKTSISSVKGTAKGIKITWKKSKGASGYYVYRKAKGESGYKKIKTTSSTSCTDTKVKTGTLYSYKIVAYKKSGKKTVKSSASAVKSWAWVKSPSLSSVKNASAGAATAKWKKVSRASGYQIAYAADKKFSSAKKINVKAAVRKKTISALAKNKTYYVRVRAYWRYAGKTYYSAWSGTKAVRVKK